MVRTIPLACLLAAASLAVALPASADCKADMAELKARLAASNHKAPNVVRANTELLKAQANSDDEVACDNAVARAWRAYRTKPPPNVNGK